MLNNLIFVNTVRFLLLVLVQVLLLNQINLFGYVNPYLYLLFIIIYPFTGNKSLLIFLSFLLGLFVDFFSDSGGIQEEAPTFNVPVLVLRETTERPEAITLGVSKLVGMDKSAIIESFNLFNPIFKKGFVNPYGNGNSSEKTIEILLH